MAQPMKQQAFKNVTVAAVKPLCDKVTCVDTSRTTYIHRNTEGTRFWSCEHEWEKVEGGRKCTECGKFDRQYAPG